LALIGLEKIEDIIELVLYSGHIKNARPLSLMIIAPIGSGKTELLKSVSTNKGIAYLTDATAYGIIKNCFTDLKLGKLKHLIIPDLLTPLSKQRSTRDTFVAFLNALIEEGIAEIRTYVISEKFENLKCGIITSIPQDDFKMSRKNWRRIGFLSRCIPVSYTYPQSSVIQILQSIAKEGLYILSERKVTLPEKDVYIKESKEINERLIPISIVFQQAEKVYGFRKQKQLQTLMMANALRSGRHEVNESDYKKVLDLSDYMNLDFKEVK